MRGLVMVFVVACSSRKPAGPSEATITKMFDAVGDRIAADLRAKTAKPHKSQVAIIEVACTTH